MLKISYRVSEINSVENLPCQVIIVCFTDITDFSVAEPVSSHAARPPAKGEQFRWSLQYPTKLNTEKIYQAASYVTFQVTNQVETRRHIEHS